MGKGRQHKITINRCKPYVLSANGQKLKFMHVRVLPNGKNRPGHKEVLFFSHNKWNNIKPIIQICLLGVLGSIPQ